MATLVDSILAWGSHYVTLGVPFLFPLIGIEFIVGYLYQGWLEADRREMP
jgi:hypothetical protein